MDNAFPRIRMDLVILSLLFACAALGPTHLSGQETNFLAPQSIQATGTKRILALAVQFPDAKPSRSLEDIRRRTSDILNRYVEEQSFGLASVKVDLKGWIMLPHPLTDYRVSQYNFKVDRGRVRKLIEDTMTAVENEVDFSSYDHILIVPGVHTTAGKGYGMICYCANPGMLSGTGRRSVPRYETLRARGGKEFGGGVFMGTENAHLGMFAHDYFHALAGVHEGKRLAP